jgi:hypothetical protein
VLFSFPVMVGFVAAASILKNPRIRTGTGRGWRHTIEGKRPPFAGPAHCPHEPRQIEANNKVRP